MMENRCIMKPWGQSLKGAANGSATKEMQACLLILSDTDGSEIELNPSAMDYWTDSNPNMMKNPIFDQEIVILVQTTAGRRRRVANSPKMINVPPSN